MSSLHPSSFLLVVRFLFSSAIKWMDLQFLMQPEHIAHRLLRFFHDFSQGSLCSAPFSVCSVVTALHVCPALWTQCLGVGGWLFHSHYNHSSLMNLPHIQVNWAHYSHLSELFRDNKEENWTLVLFLWYFRWLSVESYDSTVHVLLMSCLGYNLASRWFISVVNWEKR